MVIAIAAEEEGLKIFGGRHELDAHSGDDAEAGLREQAIEGGPNAPAEQGPGIGIGKAGEAGGDAISVGKNDLQSGGMVEVFAVGGVAEAAFERVAD